MTAEPLRPRLRRALLVAMKQRDEVATAALRSALAALDNAEALPPPEPPGPGSGTGVIAGALLGLGSGEAPRVELPTGTVRAIVLAEVTERRTAAAQYATAGHHDHAARLSAEADVLAAHLVDS